MPRPKGSKNKKTLMDNLPFTISHINEDYLLCRKLAHESGDFENVHKLLCWQSDRMWGKARQQIDAKIDTDIQIQVQIGEKQVDAIDVTGESKGVSHGGTVGAVPSIYVSGSDDE